MKTRDWCQQGAIAAAALVAAWWAAIPVSVQTISVPAVAPIGAV